MQNGESIPLNAIPKLDFFHFKAALTEGVTKGSRIAGLWAVPSGYEYTLFSALLDPATRTLGKDVPWGYYRTQSPLLSVHSTGDCFARAYVRWMEIQESFRFLFLITESIPEESSGEDALLPGDLGSTHLPLDPESFCIALTEGWRGEIVHLAATNQEGKFAWYRVFDPSFHNWFGLAYAMREGEISDFPLCNKSFNLSYFGHDL